tara:strand:+ start:289 stop:705 length:417 start_codon:yes stop_codon:yes gene_type:complete
MAKSSPTKFLGATASMKRGLQAVTGGNNRGKDLMGINPPPGNIDINAGGLGTVVGGVITKKQKFGQPTPFTMKGSPFQRNFGISPLKQGSEHQTMDPQDMFGGTSTTPTQSDLMKKKIKEKLSSSTAGGWSGHSVPPI